jgi:hypothetical protein
LVAPRTPADIRDKQAVIDATAATIDILRTRATRADR